MSSYEYQGLPIDVQIVDFYDSLELADYDYRIEIDNGYMNIILTEMWSLNLTEEQSYDLEYLAQQAERRPVDHVYSAKELECLYEVLSSFKDDLFKKHNINS